MPIKTRLAPTRVAQGTAGQDQRSEGECVDTDHPLQFGYAAAERSADAAQGGADDGDIRLYHAKSRGSSPRASGGFTRLERVFGCTVPFTNDFFLCSIPRPLDCDRQLGPLHRFAFI